MHGYFLSLKLYDAARVITNPFVYEEHREKLIKDKMEKLAETRIRARKDANAPKVNKALAKRIEKEEERQRKMEERKKERRKAKTAQAGEEQEEMVDSEAGETSSKPNLLSDPRFAAIFKNPEFEVDEDSREFNLLNPSVAAQKQKGKTAVEEEEEESDNQSSSLSDSDNSDDDLDSEDSSDAGDLDQFNPRDRTVVESQTSSTRRPTKQLRMVSATPQIAGNTSRSNISKDASFNERRQAISGAGNRRNQKYQKTSTKGTNGAMEFSWVPESGSSSNARRVSEVTDPSDMLVPGGRGKKKENGKHRNAERFGAGLERGGFGNQDRQEKLSETERHGRTRRRSDVRSGSKNAFRGL